MSFCTDNNLDIQSKKGASLLRAPNVVGVDEETHLPKRQDSVKISNIAPGPKPVRSMAAAKVSLGYILHLLKLISLN